MKAHILSIIMIVMILPAFGQVEKIRNLQQSLPSIQDSTQYVDVVNRISLLFYEQNADSTLYYGLQAREIAFRLHYAKGLADATNNLGVVFDIKGNIQLALRYYNDAYNQYTALDDSSNIVQTLMNIATVYGISGKDQKALVNFDRALLLGSRIAHDSITALVIYNYILTYPQKFSDSRKAELTERASGIATKYRDSRLKLAIQQLRADNLIANNDTEKGMRLLESTLAETLHMQLYYLSMDLLIDLGDNYFADNPEKALQFYVQALGIAEQKSYRMYAKVICKKLYDIYLSKNDHTTAFVYSQRLLKLYEEQAEIDRVSGIDYIEYAVKDQQLISQQIAADYNSKMLWLALAICFLTILSIIFLWRNWKLTRKTNDVLTLQFRQLESTTEALESSNQNYARLIKMVAHDLRNPIGGIYSLSSLILEEELSGAKLTEFVQLISESSDSCLKLIGDLLRTDFDFKESELRKEEFNLSGFLQQAVTLLAFKANEKNQQLILEESVQTMITADPDKLLRVLNNLIVNAIKFSPEGGIIEVNTERSDNGIVISVKDYGLGIPASYAPKLFDPFTPAKRKGTAGEQPFGLGLYISKQIIDAHRGRIWFESEEGKGTTFFVFLPEEKSFVGEAKIIQKDTGGN
jgi:signal transduction histidine kinase